MCKCYLGCLEKIFCFLRPLLVHEASISLIRRAEDLFPGGEVGDALGGGPKDSAFFDDAAHGKTNHESQCQGLVGPPGKKYHGFDKGNVPVSSDFSN